MKTLDFIVLWLLFACLCFALAYHFSSGDLSNKEPEIIKKSTPTSGELTWYTSIPQRHVDRIANAFRVHTGIDVKTVRNSTFIVKERLMSEIKNGETRADLLTIADIGTFIELKKKGYLLEYPSVHYQNIPERFKDTNFWAVFAGFGICMAYNKNRVNTPPEKWIDLLSGKWRGRIGIEDINTGGSQYGQYYMLRETLGVKFWEKLLSGQQPKIYFKTEALADALLRGEISIAAQFSIHIVYDYKMNRQTPIEGIYPKEGIPFIVNPVAILSRTKNTKEAKIFFDFLLSQKGQQLMQKLTYKYSLLDNITPLDGIPSLKNISILFPEDKEDYAGKKEVYSREFNRFFNIKEAAYED